jgi:hypothetical protein
MYTGAKAAAMSGLWSRGREGNVGMGPRLGRRRPGPGRALACMRGAEIWFCAVSRFNQVLKTWEPAARGGPARACCV